MAPAGLKWILFAGVLLCVGIGVNSNVYIDVPKTNFLLESPDDVAEVLVYFKLEVQSDSVTLELYRTGAEPTLIKSFTPTDTWRCQLIWCHYKVPISERNKARHFILLSQWDHSRKIHSKRSPIIEVKVKGRSSYGCWSHSEIDMTCPNANDPLEAKYIRIDRATYGAYNPYTRPDCANQCCLPDSGDCEQDMTVNYQPDFDALLDACDMTENSCKVNAIDSNSVGICPAPSVSNFQVVYYTCVLSDGSVPVPITTTTGRPAMANVALGKLTYQSKDAYHTRGSSRLAVDGDLRGNFHMGSCTHTSVQDEYPAWWAVDLGEIYRIYRVGIQNRADCCSSRLQKFGIGFSKESMQKFDDNPLINPSDIFSELRFCVLHFPRVHMGEYKSFKCRGLGRSVIIARMTSGILTLCEVEVFGEKLIGGRLDPEDDVEHPPEIFQSEVSGVRAIDPAAIGWIVGIAVGAVLCATALAAGVVAVYKRTRPIGSVDAGTLEDNEMAGIPPANI